MEDFRSTNVLEHFVPVWTEGQWQLKSLRTNKSYSLSELVPLRHPSAPLSTFQMYEDYANQASVYWLAHEFFVHWLKQMYELNSVYVAEDAYYAYLKEHLVDGVKKPAKVYKGADAAYESALKNYMNSLEKY